MKTKAQVQENDVEDSAAPSKPYHLWLDEVPRVWKLQPSGLHVSQREGRTLVISQRGFEKDEGDQIARSDRTHFRRSLELIVSKHAWERLASRFLIHQGQLLRKGLRVGFWGCEACVLVRGFGECGGS